MSVKKKLIIAVIVMALTIFIAGQIAGAVIENNMEALKEAPVVDVDLPNVEDGIYEGSYSVFPVSVELTVQVVDHRIINVEIIKHQNGQGTPAEAIAQTVVDQQTLLVDDVAGATYSSLVIKKALEAAFQ